MSGIRALYDKSPYYQHYSNLQPLMEKVIDILDSKVDKSSRADKAKELKDTIDQFQNEVNSQNNYNARNHRRRYHNYEQLSDPTTIIHSWITARIQQGNITEAMALCDRLGDADVFIPALDSIIQAAEQSPQLFTAKDVKSFIKTYEGIDGKADLTASALAIKMIQAQKPLLEKGLSNLENGDTSILTHFKNFGFHDEVNVVFGQGEIIGAIIGGVSKTDGNARDSILDLASALGYGDDKKIAAWRKADRPNILPVALVTGLVSPKSVHEFLSAALGNLRGVNTLGNPPKNVDDAKKQMIELLSLSDQHIEYVKKQHLNPQEVLHFATLGGAAGPSIHEDPSSIVGLWHMPPINHRGMLIPGEMLFVGLERCNLKQFPPADAAELEKHPAHSMGVPTKKLLEYFQKQEYVPKVEIQFSDRTVPQEAQKNLVGTKRWISGEEVLKLYAAATAQPKWLAHDELIHHQPRPSIMAAIAEYVGLDVADVEKYFKKGGWGRLFHGNGEPIIAHGKEIPAGRIITEYLKLAPEALDDFLSAQTDKPQADANGDPLPFPVSDTACELVANQLNLEKRDVKEWLQHRRFFRKSEDGGAKIDKPRLAPALNNDGTGLQQPLSLVQSLAKDSIMQNIKNNTVDTMFVTDALAEQLPNKVATADDDFMKLVVKHVSAQGVKRASSNVLSVSKDLVDDISNFAKNTAHLRTEMRQRQEISKKALDKLMDLDGLDAAKDAMKKAFAQAEQQQARKNDGKKAVSISLHARFEGNPGTGKTTVARIYAEGLKEAGVLSKGQLVEVGGAELLGMGLAGFKQKLDEAKGGVLLIDEIYQLDPKKNEAGRQISEMLLKVMEDQRDDLVIIATGYNKQMEDFISSNPGFNRRFAQKVPFEDYSDDQLKNILKKMVKGNDYDVSDATADKVIRRVSKMRGPGFGNAGTVRNVFETAVRNQMLRISETKVPTSELSEADFLGAESQKIDAPSAALEKLKTFSGLDAVKKKLDAIQNTLSMNQERERLGLPPVPIALHASFVGNPGTGKTTVAKMYGQFLKEKGLLSNGEVMVVKRDDLVGSVLGETEKKTKDILERARGKVLVIDEAYALHSDLKGDYGAVALDTLVGAIQGVAGEDICVVMCGYQDRMHEMMQKANPGLASRITQEFMFDDYDDDALRDIMKSKAKELGFNIDNAALAASVSELSRQRQKPNFGNARAVEGFLTKVCESQAERVKNLKTRDAAVMSSIILEDIDATLAALKAAEGKPAGNLSDLVGLEPLKKKMKELNALVSVAKRRGEDPRKYYQGAYMFAGPPGTGKTTAARLMGEELRKMGFLASSEVVEVQARDLIAGFVGQTNTQTESILKSALGKVLFIDEAYGLADNSNSFSQEAIDKLLKFQSDNKNNICIVLAGYDRDLDSLLERNQGLRSRFTQRIPFQSASASESAQHLGRLMAKNKFIVTADPATQHGIMDIVEKLAKAPGWSSFRDVQTLFDTATTKQALRLVDDEKADPNEFVLNDFQEALAEILLSKGVQPSNALDANTPVEVKIPMRNREMRANASINGVVGDFVIDTGAMSVTIDRAFAEKAGLDLDKARPVPVITASGYDSGWAVRVDEMNLGGIVVKDTDVTVLNQTPGGFLLGMSFLSQCDLSMQGGELTLRSKGGNTANAASNASNDNTPSAAANHTNSNMRDDAAKNQPKPLQDPRLMMFARPPQQMAPQPQVGVGVGTATKFEIKAENKPAAAVATPPDVGSGIDALERQQLTFSLEKALMKLPAAKGQAMIDAGAVPPAILKEIATELGKDRAEVQDKLEQILAEVQAAQEANQKIAAELKKKQTEWVCSFCGNSNPSCPYRAKKEGGFYREVNNKQ